MKPPAGSRIQDSSSPPLGTGAALLIGGRLVAAACGLVQVPVALAHLGPEGFGVWVALTGLLWTLGSLDGGLGFALQNRLATHWAHGREREAAALCRRGLVRLAACALLIALAGAFLVAAGDWAGWLRISDPGLATEAKPAAAIAFAAAALGVPLSLATRVAAARQLTGLTGLWTAVGSLAGLLAVVLAARLGASLPGFMLAACLLPLIPPAATWLHLRRRGVACGGTGGAPADDTGLGRESLAFFVPQLGAAFVSSFVPTLVAFFAGPAATASFGVLQRLFGLVLQLQTLALQPTWPAYTHAAARGEAETARRIYVVSLAGAGASVAATLALLPPFTPAILRLWLGGSAPEFTGVLLWMVAGWHAVQCLGQPPAMLLNGTGRAAVVAFTGTLCLVLSLALSAWLGPIGGAVGVIAALTIPYLLINLPVVIWQAARTLAAIGPRRDAPPA